MAIDIYTEPDTISTPYRPCFFDVSSDEGTIIKMIGDIYVNGVLIGTIDKDPLLGTTDTFRFDVGDTLKKNLVSEFNEVSSSPELFDDTTSALEYYVRAFEVLDNGTTFDTSWAEAGAGTNYSQSTTLYSFNGVNQHEQTLASRIADGVTKSFLTNRPQNSNILDNQDFLVGIISDVIEPNLSTLLYVEQYDGKNGTGSLLTTTNTGISTVSYQKVTYGIDPSTLDSSAQSITIHANNGVSDAVLTEDLTVNLYTACGDETVVYWQNHWGEFDTYYFEGRKRQRTKTKAKRIDNRLDLSYNSYDRGTRDISNVNEREFEIFTSTQNKATVKWLAEIGESVDVFIIEDGDRIPITVKSVTRTIEDSERLPHQISVKYVKSNPRINQLG